MNGGFVRQEFPASLVFQADPALRFEAGDAGRGRLRDRLGRDPSGLNAIAAGKARLALIVGVEKMTEVSGAQVATILLGASYRKEEDAIEGGLPGSSEKLPRTTSSVMAISRMHWRGSPLRLRTRTASPTLAQMQEKIWADRYSAALFGQEPIVAGR